MLAASTSDSVRRRYAKVAGFLFLWLIVGGIGGLALTGWLRGSGDLASQAAAIASHELAYRAAMLIEFSASVGALPLAFALYVVLHEEGERLALLALLLRTLEAATGVVALVFGFARVSMIVHPKDYGTSTEGLVALARTVGAFSVSTGSALFGFGSLLFFILFRRLPAFPRLLALVGIVASLLFIITATLMLLFPAYRELAIYGMLPMAVAEVGTGVWLLRWNGQARGN